MARRIQLLIIDPQNDFCDLPEAWCPALPDGGTRCSPALPVPGAHADLLRLSAFIGRCGEAIDDVTLTLDSHHRYDIAHPGFWRQRGGSAVAPFTPITGRQLRAGDFMPIDPTALPRVQAYLDTLEAGGRCTLTVWPVHCQIGSWGHAVHPGVLAACSAWEDRHRRPVHAVFKGSNPWTEHYSAVQAEVPDPDDADTGLNHAVLARLDSADQILIAGEASSHCVKATCEHLVAHLPSGRPERIVLLTDGMSPVSGFEAQQAAFFGAMRAAGLRTLGMADAAAQLPSMPAR